MKARIKIAEALTPDGGEMALYQHDRDYLITVNGLDLMDSRQHESELELARLGCRHLADIKAPSVLIGGLGMGYTLRQALDMLGPHARVVVGELVVAVVEWNRKFLGALNGHPLEDQRVDLQIGDIAGLISPAGHGFDAILLDVDNGPDAMTASGNRRLYGYQGIEACRRALGKKGCLAVWSAEPSKKFEQLLMQCGFHVRRFRVPAFKESKSQSRFVWVASEDKTILPPGGGEPRLPEKRNSNKDSRRPRKR
jgi:spermidine synthase